MAGQDGTAEFVAQYVAELCDLTFNSKTMINTLTMLASENKPAAPGIAEAIERRITNCAPAHKLPVLYLLDSIVKNVGLPYTALFARELPEVFMAAWRAQPQHRASLQRLYNTWHRFFPASVMSNISQRMAAPETSAAAAPAYAYQQQPQQQQQPAVSLPPPPPVPSQGGAAWPQQLEQLQQQPQQQLQYAQPLAYTNGQPGYLQPQAQQPMQAAGQWGYAAPAPAPLPQQQQPQQHFTPAYTPTYPQPQYAAGGLLQPGHSPSYAPQHISPAYPTQSPAYPGQSPAYAGPSPVAQALPPPAQQQQAAALPDFLAQLIGAGVIPAGRAGGPDPGQSAAATAAGAAQATSFAAIRDKVTAAAAVAQLQKGSAASRARFLDLRLQRQRRRAAGGPLSRQWFVREADWLAGTTADAAAAPSFFDEPQEEAAAPAAEPSVPADPEQPNCGLSGEAFESVWDEPSNAWRYKGAAALDADQAARYGLPEGTLVKVSCLGPPGAAAELEPAAEVVRQAEGQATADAVSAAAQEATAGPAPESDDKKASPRPAVDLGEEPSPKKQRT